MNNVDGGDNISILDSKNLRKAKKFKKSVSKKNIINQVKETDSDNILYLMGYTAGIGIIVTTSFDSVSLEILDLFLDI